VDSLNNFAYSNVATAPSPATSGTSLVVTAGQGSLFPAAPFDATIWPAGVQPLTTNAEIVRVTAVSTDTFTITRAQYGTTAQSIAVGYQIAQTITANLFTEATTMGGDVSGTTGSATVTAIEGVSISSGQATLLAQTQTAFTTRSASATVGIGEVSIVPAGTGAITLTLPAAPVNTQNLIINQSSNTVTISATAVNGPTTLPPGTRGTFISYSSVTSVWDGAILVNSSVFPVSVGGTGVTTSVGTGSTVLGTYSTDDVITMTITGSLI
jgi:hypothetical protein